MGLQKEGNLTQWTGDVKKKFGATNGFGPYSKGAVESLRESAIMQ